MTIIENAIEMNEAVQVDISEIMPSPFDAVKDAVKALEKDFKAITKYELAANELRREIDDIRARLAVEASGGNLDELTEITRELRRANNKLDKAIENSTDAAHNIAALKAKAVETIGAL